ncbi:MAG TPA: hypothetical protein PLW37_10785, partial [bacterium]|nr:hypothetical protein [bacterium]
MKFASCRVIAGKLLINVFSREYNKTVLESRTESSVENCAEIFKEVDYIDLVILGKEVLFFSRNYPPVKSSYIRKIIVQDIEVETPFRENDLVIDMKSFSGNGETSVFCAKKEAVKNILDLFDAVTRDKIRSIVPEEILLFKLPEKIDRALFIGDDYSMLVLRNGQIIMNGGINDLKGDLRTCFSGEDPDSE